MKFSQKLFSTIMPLLFPNKKGQNDVKNMLFSCQARLCHLWKQITMMISMMISTYS